jgi:tRNA-Thr(GGU) m(6)t(6)A37 methyltransferase TsaA
MNEIEYRPIGVIHTPFKEPRGTPVQPRAGRDIEGTVEVFEKHAKGLKDISGFSHIILIYHFHLSKRYSLEVIPFMDDQLRGLFATRAPSRPNPIGLSVVRLDRVKENVLYVRDVDIVDGTPLLDIKPYVEAFDKGEKIRKGWLDKRINELKKMRDDGRFVK